MKKIQLTQGKFTIVDDEDYPELSKHKWCAKKSAANWYAVRGVWDKAAQTTRIVRMHRVILGYDGRKEVHHKNGDSLDNQRQNIEIKTKKANLQEMNSRKNGNSG